MKCGRYWCKLPDALVLREGVDGLRISTGVTADGVSLNEREARAWAEWDNSNIGSLLSKDKMRELVSQGLVAFCRKSEIENLDRNSVIFLKIRDEFVKWYKESTDLTVLFNSAPMEQNNPLILLGPYGSLCWKGITAGWSVGEIQREVIRVFGCDQTIQFFKRLQQLGFVEKGVSICENTAEEKIKEFLAPEIQFHLRHAVLPWYCLWEINTVCDLSCETCYLPDHVSRGVSRGDALAIAKQLVDAGVFYVSLFGGEALLRKDLEVIVGFLRNNGIFVKIITNGQNLSLERARSLHSVGLNMVEVSFDGLIGDSHESIRGVGSFDKAIRAVGNSQQSGIPRVGIVYTLHEGNADQFFMLPEFMNRLKVRECYVSLFKKTGLLGKASEVKPITSITLERVKEAIERWGEKFPELTISLLPGCTCGRTSILIGHDGNARVCPFSVHSVGDVLRYGLTRVWESLGRSVSSIEPLGYCRNDSSHVELEGVHEKRS